MKKQVGLHELEAIDNANMLIIVVNPKESFEKYKVNKINKKHKGMRKDTPGMTFESFPGRIISIKEYDSSAKLPKKINPKNVLNYKYWNENGKC